MDFVRELIIVGLRVYKVLEISQVLSQAAVIQGLDVKTAEFTNEPLMMTEIVHIRMGECIDSPLILEGQADIVIYFEPLLAAHLAVKYLSPKGMILVNTHSLLSDIRLSNEVIQLLEQLADKTIKLDTISIAEKAGDIGKNNFVMLGVLDALNILPITSANIKRAVKEVVCVNDIKICLRAMELGNNTVVELKL